MRCERNILEKWPAIVALLLGMGVPVGNVHAQVKVLEYQGTPYQGLGFVANAGDVDKDGCDDFICGAPWGDSDGDGNLGEVFVYSGKKGGLLYTFKSDVPGYSGFGQAVAGGGDFDGDGTPDVIVGAWRDYLHGFGAGSVSVYSGKTGAMVMFIDGYYPGEGFGWSVDFVGDIQADDGYDEILVGAMLASYAQPFEGGTGLPMKKLSGQSPTSWFGSSVSRLGDVDGDGVPDFLVGEPKFSATWNFLNENGRAIVYSGASGTMLWEAEGLNNLDWMGLSVGHLGDVSGDGKDDVIAGAPHVWGAGAAYVVSGSDGGWLQQQYGEGQDDLFGWSVAGLGFDISGDKVPDFVVGAPGFNSSDTSELQNGYVRTFSGGDGEFFDTFAPITQTDDRNYGLSVCGGDFNGDGFGDWIIGFPDFNRDTIDNGEVEVYAGCAASWKRYGSGWPGTNRAPPLLTPSGDISPGHTVTLSLDNSSFSDTTGFLLIGVKPAEIPTKLGGTLLVSLLKMQPISVPSAGLTISGSIPNDPSLLCSNVYLQAIEADAGASKGYSFTPGLRLHIGLIYP